MKRCARCDTAQPLEGFARDSSRKDGKDPTCRSCRKSARKPPTPEAKAKSADADARRQGARRAYLESLKRRPCADCGIGYPSYVMHFDHRNPAEKSFTIARWPSTSVSMDDLHAEVAKCDVVCANCHAERTWGPGGSNPRRKFT